LVAFGAAGILTIGLPILVLGLALGGVGLSKPPLRNRSILGVLIGMAIVTAYVLAVTMGGSPPAMSGHGSVSWDRGTIRGDVTMRGGPDAKTVPVESGTLHVDGEGVDLSQPLGEHGTFEIAVPRGTFRVFATVPQYNNGGEFGQFDVVVRAGGDSEVKLVCQLR
jgi:hypothetical protein